MYIYAYVCVCVILVQEADQRYELFKRVLLLGLHTHTHADGQEAVRKAGAATVCTRPRGPASDISLPPPPSVMRDQLWGRLANIITCTHICICT